MSKKRLSLSRRKFMAVSSAAIAAPIIMNMAGNIPEAKGAEKQYNFVDKKSCDLVVLGGGGSGLVGAVRAAQLTGKKVIVLEKDSTSGGGAQGARTMRTFRSKWQAKRNLPDTTAEYARAMMDYVFWKLDPKLVSNCLLGTGQFFDWACELGGDIEDKFTEGKYKLSDLESEPIGPQMEGQNGKGFGGFMMDLMNEKCKTYSVEVLTKHPVVDVEMRDGKIVAAIAKSDKGYVRVACKACILATGSWIRNEEIMKKYAPQFAAVKQYVIGAPSAQGGIFGGGNSNVGHWSTNYTGDGIALAEKVGAFVDYDSLCLRMMGPASFSMSKVFTAMPESPYVVTVNLDGKRFCSEPVLHMGIFEGAHIQMEQPRTQTYNIFNEDTLAATFEYQKCVKAGKCTPIKTEIIFPVSNLPDTMEEIQDDLKKNLANRSSSIFRADTLEELADKIGVNKKTFLETMKNYNESCEKGVDLDVFKDKDYLLTINKPPYYAVQSGVGTDGAFGGVRVNHEMQAYKSDRKGLVEGLYVAGDFATGRHISMCGMKRQVVNDLAWAFSSGFLAGTNVAKYLKSLG
jgi:fumarate reductase flavoprotein subunit